MSTMAILREMIELTRSQTENIIQGNHRALLDDALRHEHLLSALQNAEIDGTKEEIRSLYDELTREKAKLQSLLEVENVRVDFMLRLLLGNGSRSAPGYPPGIRKRESGSRMLNRRT